MPDPDAPSSVNNDQTEEPIIPPVVNPWHLHRRLYNWVLQWADSRYGAWALFILSFSASSFFPVPPDVLLAPLTLGNRRKWWRFALNCSIASLAGGIFGYIIGMFLWVGVGDFFHNHVSGFERDQLVLRDGTTLTGLLDSRQLEPGIVGEIALPESVTIRTTDGRDITVARDEIDLDATRIHAFTRVGALYDMHDWLIVAIAGLTPLPYKVITITAGVFRIHFLIFCISSALSRALRFFLIAGLFGIFGAPIKTFIDKYLNWLCILFVVILIGGFAILKYL